MLVAEITLVFNLPPLSSTASDIHVCVRACFGVCVSGCVFVLVYVCVCFGVCVGGCVCVLMYVWVVCVCA